MIGRSLSVVPVLVVIKIMVVHGVLVACGVEHLAEKVIAVVQTRGDVVNFLIDVFDITGDFFEP